MGTYFYDPIDKSPGRLAGISRKWGYVIERGEFMMCGEALEVCMRLGLSEKGRKGVYGLGSLWRIVWCMVIGVIGGCEGVIVCDSKDMRAKRQVVEGVNPWFKFNFVLRVNDFGRDPYDAPFGGRPTHAKRQSNRNTGTIHELDAILVPFAGTSYMCISSKGPSRYITCGQMRPS